MGEGESFMMRSAKRLARSVALLARWVSDLPTSTVITVVVAALITAAVVWVTQFTVIYVPFPFGMGDDFGLEAHLDTYHELATANPASEIQWSSNGSHIISYYYLDRDRRVHLYVSAADGSSARHIPKSYGDVTVDDLIRGYVPESRDVSPDGSLLVYNTSRHYRSGDRGIMWEPSDFDTDYSGLAEIETSNLDGSDRRRLTRSINYNLLPSWSPDGSKIAFVRYAESRRYIGIYVMNRDGSGVSRIVPGQSYKKDFGESDFRILNRWIMGPVWSPSGDELAFAVKESANRLLSDAWWSLYVVNPDGSQLRRLFRTSSYSENDGVTRTILSFPAWSPDGRTVAFIAFEGGIGGWERVYLKGTFSVMSVGRDSPLREIVSFDELNGGTTFGAHLLYTLEWSPNGSSIMFSSWDIFRGGSLYRVDSDGSDLLKIAADAYRAAFSPDGSRIAVGSRTGLPSCEDCPYPAGTILYTMNPDGSDVQALARIDGDGRLKAVNAPSGWLKRVWDAVTP